MKVGNLTPKGTHGREGEAGHDVLLEGTKGGTLRPQTVSTTLHRIAQQAVEYPDMVFTTLAHLIDVDFLKEAFRRTRKDAAVGVDGVTAADYALDLDANVRDLHERLRTGRYYAPPVRRVWLAKEDGRKRPIGVPALEDKIVQRAVTMILEAVYEQSFHDCSYGFRRGRSAHDALKELREQATGMDIKWVLDADISGFFDSIDHGKLREIIRQRVNDGGLIRLIGKWLNAGVLEEGKLFHPEKGTPQGGVISPMLSNIFLHTVLDEWFEREVTPRLRGRAFLIRYADDCVPGEAARKMKEREHEWREDSTRGPSEPACRSRLQTAVSCSGQEPGWCASLEKARHRSRQVWAGKTSAIEPLMKCRKRRVTSKPGRSHWPGMSRGETCLLPRRRPA